MYVSADYRRLGMGQAVTSAVIDLAKSWQGVDWLDLSVSENSPAARRLYESLGFEPWGREPEATEYAGQRYDEIHMALRL